MAPSPSTATTERVDPRTERTRSVVVEAAADLLAEQGFERITIDGIADRSNVARSTIYRNWPDRAELLSEAFTHVCTLPEIPDHGSLVEDFAFLGRSLADGLTHDAWGQMLPSLVGAAAHDEELQRAHRLFSTSRRREALALVQRAVDRGEVPARADGDAAVERFAAGFFFRRLFTHDPLDAAFVERQVETLCRDLQVEYP